MKKRIIPALVFLSFVGGAYAQTGIGIPIPSKSSELEVHSKDKGVLIPRLELQNETDTTTVFGNNYPESLMVYHTGKGKMIAGFYFWSDNKWNAIVTNNTLYNYFNEKVVGNVTYKNGNLYYTVLGDEGKYIDKVVNLETIIKESSIIARLNVISAGNANDVKGGFTFNDGKEGSVDKPFAETLTSIERGTEVGKDKLIAYNYKDETGKNAAVQITVSSDVINNFDEIIKNEKVKNELNTFITNATGSVTVSKDAGSGNITISYKEGESIRTLDLTDEVKRVQNYGIVNLTPASLANNKGAGFTFKDGKAGSIDKVFVETLTPLDKKTVEVDLTDGTKGKEISYDYKDESGKPTTIDVTKDVTETFKTIVNEGENKKTLETIVKNVAGDGTVAKLDVITTGNANDVKGGFTFNDGKKGSVDKLFAETLTLVERKTVQVDLPDNKKGDAIEYDYKSEAGTIHKITVTKDVADTFKTIVNQGDNNEFLKQIIENIVKKEGSKVTVLRDNNEITLVVVNGENEERVNLTKAIQNSAYLASMTVKSTGNVGDVKAGFTFKDGKEGSTDKVFAETLTSIERGTETGKANLIAYNYKDETGKNATAQITVSSDVINNFDEIIKDNKVIEQLNTFITNATGSVTVTRDGNGDVIISYKGGTPVNLTQEIRTKQNYGIVTPIAAITADKKGTGFTFNNGKAEAGSYVESVTGFTTVTNDVDLEDGTKGKSIVYNYKDESVNTHNLNITQDIAKTFKTIVNQEGNKSYIENIINTAAPSASIANTAANTGDKKGAGFTFNNGKVAAGSFLESVTGFTTAMTDVDLSDGTKGKSIVYNYKDESINTHPLNITDDVATTFKTIINQGDNKTYIENISKGSNLYSTTNETISGKFDDKDIMRYVVDLAQPTSFTAVELPKAINGMILEATLINKGTNAIVRGVIGKQVSGTKTTLSIGTVGTIITSNPAGEYCVIVEYVKQ